MNRYIILLIATVLLGNHATAQDSIAYRSGPQAARAVPDSVVERMRNDKNFIYANDSSYWTKKKSAEDNFFERLLMVIGRSPLLKWVLYAFLASVIIFAIYQVIVVNDFFIFSRKRRSNAPSNGTDEALLKENLDEKLNNAIAAGKYRDAIRYMYLKTLRALADKKVIELHAKSTNQDFIRQMYKHDHLSQFRHLTRIYEYVWYGEFDPSEAQFQVITRNFNQFNP